MLRVIRWYRQRKWPAAKEEPEAEKSTEPPTEPEA